MGEPHAMLGLGQTGKLALAFYRPCPEMSNGFFLGPNLSLGCGFCLPSPYSLWAHRAGSDTKVPESQTP